MYGRYQKRPAVSICRSTPLLFLLLITGLVHGADFTGKVIAVMDGDTVMVLQGDRPVKVRLAEIDAPEKAQPYGDAAQHSLAGMVMGRQVRVSSRAMDDYGRMVAVIILGDVNVNHEQVRRGMAWEYSRFHSNRAVMVLQREAQSAKRGLWAGEEITEPSQWRKTHPSAYGIVQTEPADPSCAKKQCGQMSSCDEARDFMARCGFKSLDGDKDGVPCEELCAARRILKN